MSVIVDPDGIMFWVQINPQTNVPFWYAAFDKSSNIIFHCYIGI